MVLQQVLLSEPLVTPLIVTFEGVVVLLNDKCLGRKHCKYKVRIKEMYKYKGQPSSTKKQSPLFMSFTPNNTLYQTCFNKNTTQVE